MINNYKNDSDYIYGCLFFIIFASQTISLAVRMDYITIGVGIVTIAGGVFGGTIWAFKYIFNKGANAQHSTEFENHTKDTLNSIKEELKRMDEFNSKEVSKCFLAVSSIKDEIDKISEEQSEQKVSIARLEGKLDAIQHKKK